MTSGYASLVQAIPKKRRCLISRVLVAGSVAICSMVMATSASGQIAIDYTQDAGFFTSNTTARAALDAAVADINSALILNFGAITTDTSVGTNAEGTATFNFGYTHTNPTSGATVTTSDSTLAANEVKIYAGMRNLTGTTLGQGGPGGIAVGAGYSGTGVDIQGAVDLAMAAHEHRRGGGPTMGNLSGGLGAAAYSFDMGLTIGNLWFDSDTDNNGSTDNAATLDANWHFDHTTAVAGGKDDFYSVALHEVLHAIGYGTADSWDDLVTGTTWTGAQAIAANGGTGVGLIDGGSFAHIASGIQSARLSDGLLQDAVMTPTITTGTRKFLTQLDLAILRDIGFQTVPEPSSGAVLLTVGLIAGCSRRKRAQLV